MERLEATFVRIGIDLDSNSKAAQERSRNAEDFKESNLTMSFHLEITRFSKSAVVHRKVLQYCTVVPPNPAERGALRFYFYFV